MGYIMIDRDLLQSDFWLSEPFTVGQAWVDLIGMANYADKDKFYMGQYQRVERGQIATSMRALAERWSWSKGKTKRFLDNLVTAHMVTIKRTSKWTTITICNYNVYQDPANTKRTSKRPQNDRRRTADGPQTDTQEEINKEIREEEREHAARAPVSPSLEDVILYQKETGLSVDPEAFWNFYEGSGWMRKGDPIRNWKAVFRSWEGKEDYGAQPAVTSKSVIDAWLRDKEGIAQ